MEKSLNKNLHSAKKAKNDEFYTQLSDIEREMQHYKTHFEGKTIYCNCDDPESSNFFRFFSLQFGILNLKKLITTHFVYSDVFVEGETYKLEIDRTLDLNLDGKIDLSDLVKTPLKSNGDFRSEECIEILKEADIVVTNPPFSLFREYVAQLMEYDKKFIIIGSQNAITYKEIFKFIKENKLWLGHGFSNGNAYFGVNNPRDFVDGVYDEEKGLVKFRNIHWFTNLDHKKRHEDIILWQKYTSEKYPKYDNYDAINVDKTADIPCDYDGVMGVPITFLDKWNPEQFEVVDPKQYFNLEFAPSYAPCIPWYTITGGRAKYARITIKNKKLIKGV